MQGAYFIKLSIPQQFFFNAVTTPEKDQVALAVVVEQSVKQLLPTPEIIGSSQVFGQSYLLSTVLKLN